MDFNMELEQLIQSKNQCLVDVGTDDKRQEELEEYYSRIDAYCKVLASYSYFEEKAIGNTIASLMSVYEGINYIYHNFTKPLQQLDVDGEEAVVRKYFRIIVAEEYREDLYSDDKNSLDLLVENGKALVLDDDAYALKRGISFYYPDINAHNLGQSVKFGKFSYVKEFVDSLISYKFENKSNDIPYDDVVNIVSEFVSSKVKEIEENYRIVDQQQEEQMKQKLASDQEKRQLKLRKILDKNFTI